MSILLNLLKDTLFRRTVASLDGVSTGTVPLQKSIEGARQLCLNGDFQAAMSICREVQKFRPDNVEVGELISDIAHHLLTENVRKRFPGPEYLEWLNWFHLKLVPDTYLEIGVETGQSLQFSKAPTRAVGVDPDMRIIFPQENWVKLFKQTSDVFFEKNTIKTVFGAEVINLAFIDGLHTFDQVLRDFSNVEKHSDENTVVLLHDIFPVIPETAKRERETRFWVGDTWKVMLILKNSRPDLRVFTIPTFPSGLGVVTGLNKRSTLLTSDFDRLCQEAIKYELSAHMDELNLHLNTIENDFSTVAGLLNR